MADTIEPAASEKRHPIQVVSRRTGLSADVLRVWEKRYEVVSPGRSSGGHRLYSDEDVELLALLNRAVSAGRRISRVARLGFDELEDLVREDEHAAEQRRRKVDRKLSTAPEVYLAACLGAVEASDAPRLEKALTRAAFALSARSLIEDVIGPLLVGIGERWEHGKMSPGQEHLASAVVRRVLESLSSSAMPGPEAPGLVVGTPAGQVHEFGALFVAAAAAVQGWRVTYLGTSLPAGDIAEIARDTSAAAIALSVVFPSGDSGVAKELVRLRSGVGPTLPILIGGGAAHSYQEAVDTIGGRVVEDLGGLYANLEAIAAQDTG